MSLRLKEIRHNPLLWLLAFVPPAVLLVVAHGLGTLFSLKTHRELFALTLYLLRRLWCSEMAVHACTANHHNAHV